MKARIKAAHYFEVSALKNDAESVKMIKSVFDHAIATVLKNRRPKQCNVL